MNRRREIRLERLTRQEFREALEAGQFRAAIIATGAISSTWSTSPSRRT